MKILDRYILRQFLGTFVLLVAALPFLFLITDLTDNLDRYLGRGIPLRVVGVSYVYFLPQLVFWGFPVAGLIATVFTISGMTRHQEITAAKAGGVSFYRLAAPLVFVAAVLSVVAVGIGEIVPASNLRRAEILGEREQITSPYRLNFVFRTENGRTLAANRINAQAQVMDQVMIEGWSSDGSMRINHSATSATWEEHVGWTLRDGYVRWFPEEGEPVAFYFTAMRIPDLQERPEEFLTDAKQPDEMQYGELKKFIRTVERSGADSSRFRVNLAQRISLPIALFVIVLFGAPLATTSSRGGPAFGVGISLAVTMIYLMMFKVGEAMGESGAAHPLIAAWTPNVVFLIAALALLKKVRT